MTYRNRIGQQTSTVGTGPLALGAAIESSVSGNYQALGAADDTHAFDILILDGSAWEIATGCVYSHAVKTLTRGTLEESSTGTVLNLSGHASVYVTLTAAVLASLARISYDGFGNPVLIAADGSSLSLSLATKLVRVTTDNTVIPSGVETVLPLAVAFVDTHSLVDLINDTILVPTGATMLSCGLVVIQSWGSTVGTYRRFGVQGEIIPGYFVTISHRAEVPALGISNAGAISEMFDVSSYSGKRIRFFAQQDSGGPLSVAPQFYAQFLGT